MRLRAAAICAGASLVSACAMGPTREDPFEPVNRVSYKVHEVVDGRIIKPVAQAYADYTPKPVRLAVSTDYRGAPPDERAPTMQKDGIATAGEVKIAFGDQRLQQHVVVVTPGVGPEIVEAGGAPGSRDQLIGVEGDQILGAAHCRSMAQQPLYPSRPRRWRPRHLAHVYLARTAMRRRAR